MKNPSARPAAHSQGSALLIVLAFLLLLTTLTVAFLSRATLERQLSNASFSQGKSDLAGQGAINAIIGDLQQEIVAGSNVGAGTTIPSVATGYYYPNNPATVIPAVVGFTPAAGVEDLLKISYRSTSFWPSSSNTTASNYNATSAGYYNANAVPSRAASVSTVNDPSLNNRFVSKARWNKPLLMNPINVATTVTDFTPPAAFTSNPPDWIYVAPDGSNPGSSNGSAWSSAMTVSGSTPVTQRYAYAIYDEGSTLDLNVAGSPISTTGTSANIGSYSNNQPYKNALAYADLLQLPYNGPGTSTLSAYLTTAAQKEAFINAIVGWRNFTSSGLTSTSIFPNTYPFNYITTTTPPTGTVANFDQNVIFNSSGFLTVSGTAPQYGPNFKGSRNQTDNAFASRQQLLQFFLQGLGQNSNGSTNFLSSTGLTLANLENLMPYLGTFSRDISQPSYAPPPLLYNATYNPSGSTTGRPAVLVSTAGGNSAAPDVNGTSPAASIDNKVNPAFLATTVTTSFTRNDGSTAIVGEPLVKKRFALNRLAWITYKGPSATVYASTPTDANLVALMNDGIPASFLQQGTAANIQKYFGLDWDATNHVWDYDYHNSAGAPATGSKGPIMQLGLIAALTTPRDPDFFELLKASIGVGSVGKALLYSNTATTPTNGNVPASTYPYSWNYYAESSVDYQILQIGANIIAQFQPANYAPQIVFNDGQAQSYSGSNPSAGLRTIVGVENLPYLSLVTNGAIQVKPTTSTSSNGAPGNNFTNSGIGAWLQVPVVWDPYDPTSSLNGGSGLGPTKFRVVADSTTPDQAVAAAAAGYTSSSLSNYNSFFVYGTTYGYNSNAASNSSTYGSNNGYYNTTSKTTTASYVDTVGDGSGIAQKITASNSEIDFTVTPVKSNFCPEPVALLQAATITDSNTNTISVSLGASHLLTTDLAIIQFLTGSGATQGVPSVNSEMGSLPANTTPYVGFYLGAFPLAWLTNVTSPTVPATCVLISGSMAGGKWVNGAHLARVLPGVLNNPAGDQRSCYMTYRMQYQDPITTTNWITYDTKYGQAYGSQNGCGDFPNYDSYMYLFSQTDTGFPVDPRTSRFGLHWNGHISDGVASNTPPFASNSPVDWADQPVSNGNVGAVPPGGTQFVGSTWIDSANGIMYSVRPDARSGFYATHSWPWNQYTVNTPNTAMSSSAPASGWMANVAVLDTAHHNIILSFPGLAPGLLSQNNTDIFYNSIIFAGTGQGGGNSTGNYFADPDGIVRRAMGAYIPLASSGWSLPNGPADTTVGLPGPVAFAGDGDPSITAYPGTVPTSPAPTSQAQSRPYFLHRPFYSVAELGYVFSDTPWRNLDFFTAESGNTALLDTFCINDTNDPGGLVAGKVNLNTRQTAVLQAVIAGGCFDPSFYPPAAGSSPGPVGQIDSITANLVAAALVARTTDTANIGNGTGPLQNVSELVGKYMYSVPIWGLGNLITCRDDGTLASGTGFYDGKLSYAGFSGGVWDNTASAQQWGAAHCPYPNPYSTSPNPYTTISGGVEDFSAMSSGIRTGAPKSTTNPEDVYAALMKSSSFTSNANHNGSRETVTYIQRFREAPIRALAAAGTTRVWNLMIDVIAQTGRFPSSASSLANFNVEGERRYWVHVAIDRYTGKVLDEQVEEVKE